MVDVHFDCPICEQPARLNIGPATDWQCPQCEHRLRLDPGDGKLEQCLVCGNHELYKKKDFPHRLGMAILLVALLITIFTHGYYQKWWTWAILLGTALFDGLLYLWVGDAIVCYRCLAHYRGLPPSERHRPHELIVAERYRQEKIRRQQMP